MVKSSFCRMAELVCVVALCVLVAGCGGDGGEDASSSSSSSSSSSATSSAGSGESSASQSSASEGEKAAEPEKEEAAASAGQKSPASVGVTGSFVGRIVLDGDPPALDPLVKPGDTTAKDGEVCGVAGVPDESLVVGEGNGIANVLVYLRRAPKGVDVGAVPEEPVVVDQKGCVFLPHVAVIRVGQKVLVKSADPIVHNMHTFPRKNSSSNIPVSPNDRKGVEIVYSTAETDPVPVKCDIHTWMSAYHLVVDHPFAAKTDDKGQFSIDGLPAGKYEFRVWHERAGLLEKGYEVTISGDDQPVELKYAAAKFAGN